MTDALKAAVREALSEALNCKPDALFLDLATFALARRGVVVAERGQKAAMDRLKESAQCYYAANVAGQDKVEGTAYDLFESAEAVLAFCTSPQAAAGESPAPKPARKVVQVSAADSYALAVCNDGAVLIASPGMGYDEWRILPPIPQPGDDQ
jgi:hypothetical protein